MLEQSGVRVWRSESADGAGRVIQGLVNCGERTVVSILDPDDFPVREGTPSDPWWSFGKWAIEGQ